MHDLLKHLIQKSCNGSSNILLQDKHVVSTEQDCGRERVAIHKWFDIVNADVTSEQADWDYGVADDQFLKHVTKSAVLKLTRI